MNDTNDKMSGGNVRARHFMIVINNFEKKHEDYVKNETWKYTYQIEKDDNTGTLHLSGVISFKNPRYREAIRKVLPGYVEVVKSLKACIEYNMKTHTRVRGPYSTHRVIIKDYFDYSKMSYFHKEILDILSKEPDERKIYW